MDNDKAPYSPSAFEWLPVAALSTAASSSSSRCAFRRPSEPVGFGRRPHPAKCIPRTDPKGRELRIFWRTLRAQLDLRPIKHSVHTLGGLGGTRSHQAQCLHPRRPWEHNAKGPKESKTNKVPPSLGRPTPECSVVWCLTQALHMKRVWSHQA